MHLLKVYPKYQENLIENIQVLTEMAIELLFSEIEISAVSKVNKDIFYFLLQYLFICILFLIQKITEICLM